MSNARGRALAALAAVAVLAVGFLLGSVAGPDPEPDPTTDSVTVGFAQDMVAHHLQAVQMANVAQARSTDPAITTLAFDIASTQQGQIGQMQGWLGLWGQPTLPTGGHMGWMSDSAMAGHDMGDGMDVAGSPDGTVERMPGMATTAELTELRDGDDAEVDVLFLQLMLRHHVGGGGMLTYAAEEADEPLVRSFATQVGSSQAAESATMTRMLAERDAEPLPLDQ